MDKPQEKKGVGSFAHTRGTPPRVAARLEGVVKNRGTKPRRKKKGTHKKSRISRIK